MAEKWQVKFTDDDEDSVQVASFATYNDAQMWIKNQEVQNRYDNVHFRVVDGPYETSRQMLTEGKHWPEDYIKTAINTIKGSQTGKQPWCTDELLQSAFAGQHDINRIDVKDISHSPRSYGILGKFEPLMHQNSNLGFFTTIARWLAEYSGTSQKKFQDFISNKFNDIVKVLLKILSDKTYDSQRDAIKKMSFSEFEKLVEQINDKSIDDDIVAPSNMKFSIVPIYSYDELHEYYGGPVTGYKGDSEWCHTNGRGTYDSENWTDGGKNMFFVIEADGWENITAPDVPYDGKTSLAWPDYNAYDKYGMSLIAILVDVQSNMLLHSTSRWNHIILPKSGYADAMFESWQQLNKAVQLDVEKICLDECKDLKEKLQQKSNAANEEVAQILKNVKIITDVTVPKELRSIVTEVNIPFGVESIGDYAFWNCKSLKSITIPDSVESIRNKAFRNCKSLKSIVIPDSVKSIEDYAFSDCTSLTSITIPNSVKNIKYSAFSDCTSLTSITIPNSVKSIGDYAFYGCTSLKGITLPDLIESIGDFTFANCKFLESIIIPNLVNNIGNGAFSSCTSLKSIVIPNLVESLGNGAFGSCTSLKSIIIPDSVKSIGIGAFSNCASLISIAIPDSVKSIGEWAFAKCKSLKEVIFKEKTMDQVKGMDNYPWNIKDISIIRCENSLDESNFAYGPTTKIWVDDIRPAPDGYVWLKSVNEFIDYMVEHGLHNILVFDFDHDAGDYASDGGDYIKCLDWLEDVGADNINVRVHSANPAGAAKMRQIIHKNQWNEVYDVIEQPLSREQQVRTLFESIEPESLAVAKDWIDVSNEHPAYAAAQSVLASTEGISIKDVYKANGSDCYIAELVGSIGNDVDPQRWLKFLEAVKRLIARMLSNGCKDVWLVDFNNDAPDGRFILRIGFQLLSSAFEPDVADVANEMVDEAEKASKKDSDGPEDAKAKGKVVNALKDASKQFQKMASNNDPEQFAKIVVAFDDLTAGVGAYDFKKKRKLEEDDEADDKDATKGILAALMQKLSDAGAKCSTAELQSDGIVKVNGEFNDRIPLDCLLFRWHFEDEYNPTGWYECTKCMNKWRGVGKEILDKLAPNGLDAMDLQEVEDGN